MARAQQTLKKWQLAVTLLLGFLCTSLQAVPHSTQSHLGSNHFASQIALAQCSEFAEDLSREDRLLELRLTLEITIRTAGDPIAFTNPFRFSLLIGAFSVSRLMVSTECSLGSHFHCFASRRVHSLLCQ